MLSSLTHSGSIHLSTTMSLPIAVAVTFLGEEGAVCSGTEYHAILLRSDTDPYCSSDCTVLHAHAVNMVGHK